MRTRLWLQSTFLSVFTLLTVFACTLATASAGSTLNVTREDIFLLPAQNNLSFEVVESLTIQNPSSQVRDVEIVLPRGASGVQILREGKTVAVRSAGSQLILPSFAKAQATTQLMVSFVLPFPQQGSEFTLHSTYSVDRANVFLPIGNMAFSAEGLLTQTNTATIGQVTYREFTRLGIPSGDDWTMSLQLLPSASPTSASNPLKVISQGTDSRSNTLQAIGNLVVAAVVFVIGMLGIRSTQWGRSAGPRSTPEEALYRSWESLERTYSEGALPEDEYQKRRSELKGKLVRLSVDKE